MHQKSLNKIAAKIALMFPTYFARQTREELRGALESEMRAFAMDKDLSGNYVVSWNHLEFEVLYECLADELKIGNS